MNMFPKMKIVLALLLFVLVSSASALMPDIDKVQSKEGNLELTQFEDGSGSTCTMFFEEPASIRKDGGPKSSFKNIFRLYRMGRKKISGIRAFAKIQPSAL